MTNNVKKRLYNLHLLTYLMNQIKMFIAVIAMIGIVTVTAGTQNVSAMYEDQIEVCNFEKVCQIVNIDDYMSRDKADKLQSNFNNDLDTYSKIQALDEECRDNYHSFCFGESWNSLQEVLSK